MQCLFNWSLMKEDWHFNWILHHYLRTTWWIRNTMSRMNKRSTIRVPWNSTTWKAWEGHSKWLFVATWRERIRKERKVLFGSFLLMLRDSLKRLLFTLVACALGKVYVDSFWHGTDRMRHFGSQELYITESMQMIVFVINTHSIAYVFPPPRQHTCAHLTACRLYVVYCSKTKRACSLIVNQFSMQLDNSWSCRCRTWTLHLSPSTIRQNITKHILSVYQGLYDKFVVVVLVFYSRSLW